MKYLLVVMVVIFGFWLWKKNRANNAAADAKPAPGRPSSQEGSKDQPQLMLRCAHCGTHLPQTEAIAGRQGHYCSLAHRQQSEAEYR
jgi:uncharacterized protein